MVRLTGPQFGPASGKRPRQIVILLHGVGADGEDLIDLAPSFASALPDALFLSPDAPYPCDMAPMGRQWFSLRDFSSAAIFAGVCATAPLLDAFIDDHLAAQGLTAANLALVGFSQGTMMALHVALRRQVPVAALIGYSGLLAGPEVLAREIRSRPPTLLIHGSADDVVPPSCLPVAEAALKKAGVPVRSVLCHGLGHGIDETGIEEGATFLARHLGS